MTIRLDPFYLIVDDADALSQLVPLGVKLVQLRIKGQSDTRIAQEIRSAKAICTQYGTQLIINDYWQAAIDARCNFVHLGQEDLNSADIPALRNAGIRIGISTHDEAELTRALSFKPDYVALGPIYPTRLKKMPWAPQGLERIAHWKRLIGDCPLVAIGGLNIERLAGVFGAGADSAAVVTDISLHSNPQNRVLQWLDATRAQC